MGRRHPSSTLPGVADYPTACGIPSRREKAAYSIGVAMVTCSTTYPANGLDVPSANLTELQVSRSLCLFNTFFELYD